MTAVVITQSGLEEPLEVRDVGEQFIELVCADDDLLAAEFEAIIAAGWPPQESTSPEGATSDASEDTSPRPAPTRAHARWMPSRSTSRERSPPPPNLNEEMT